MAYQTSAHDPTDIKPELTRLWSENLHDVGSQERADDKFAWLYERAPFGGARAYLARGDAAGGDAAVGTCTLQTRGFYVMGQPHTTGLFADLAVDAAHRTGAPALQLLRHVRADATARFPFALGFPNAKAMAVFKRAGFAELGQMRRYAIILRHERYVPRAAAAISPLLPPALSKWVAEQTEMPAVQRMLGTAADWATMLLRATSVRHAVGPQEEPPQVYESLPASDDDPLVAELVRVWERGYGDVALASARSLAFLRWRVEPWREHFVVVLRDAEGPCGYALCTVQDQICHIRDLFGSLAGVEALAAQLPSVCYDRGLVGASFRYLGAPWLGQALEAAGFSLRAETRMVAVCFDEHSPLAANDLRLAANWLVTDIDEDT